MVSTSVLPCCRRKPCCTFHSWPNYNNHWATGTIICESENLISAVVLPPSSVVVPPFPLVEIAPIVGEEVPNPVIPVLVLTSVLVVLVFIPVESEVEAELSSVVAAPKELE